MLNTPSHHRVHHGVNDQYLDRNYGGILIIWDKLFGTYEPEGERVRYGLTTQLAHASARSGSPSTSTSRCGTTSSARPRLRDKFGVVFHGPGWTPPGVNESEATRG